MQRIATGQLGWSPRQFWRSTWPEVQAAIEGRTGRRIKDVITPERAREVARLHPPTKSIRKPSQ
ncbi:MULTISPECIES: phage tail assembly chaperone [Brucella]|uniref:phage tail assembly chaperone n=1 Tax=Brucella TaxID=234 RepID=UPI000EFB980D|nr:phage tail assembly chaperone [Brucella anthropi]KAB2739670.1 phage tail assembly chaperone [Brucella anthropi]KAB2802029.1 phage tail assembly chaperone [Brucella anthropi]